MTESQKECVIRSAVRSFGSTDGSIPYPEMFHNWFKMHGYAEQEQELLAHIPVMLKNGTARMAGGRRPHKAYFVMCPEYKQRDLRVGYRS